MSDFQSLNARRKLGAIGAWLSAAIFVELIVVVLVFLPKFANITTETLTYKSARFILLSTFLNTCHSNMSQYVTVTCHSKT
jgi:hypothetical protein